MSDETPTLTVADAEREALVLLDAWHVALDRASWQDVVDSARNLYRAAHVLREARTAEQAKGAPKA